MELYVLAGACPFTVQPDKLVVAFNDLATANCSTNSKHDGLGWEASQGAVDLKEGVRSITWSVKHIAHWDIQPICYMNIDTEQCELKLSVIIYSESYLTCRL